MRLKNTGKITVIPVSGLANRLRVVATSIKLARESNKKINIYWQANKYLNAGFNDLFIAPGSYVVKKPPFKYSIWLIMKSHSVKLNRLSKWYLKLFKFDYIFLDAMAPMVWRNKIDLQKEVDQYEDVFICSCQELNYFDLEDYKLFVPKDELMKKINSISNMFRPNTIGIHIRSTDNEMAKQHSPFNIFLEKINGEISIDPNASFFISTDNEEYQKELLEEFGSDRIIFNAKEFRRDVSKGIKDAVIDLFCLAKTSRIYGSYNSSFSWVAGRIGNVPVEILKK
ncbi:MAG TPA: hypothetical protein VFI29_16325 [Hanamia sp.]|nr:hypothetical protein [Hanamia sp.]